MVPYFAERIKGYYDEIIMHPNIYGRDVYPYSDRMKEHPIEHFKRFYADTATSGSLAALRCGYDFAGQDRVVFGTDFPYGPELGERWTRQIMQNIRDFEIPEEAKAKIWEGNARKLLKLA